MKPFFQNLTLFLVLAFLLGALTSLTACTKSGISSDDDFDKATPNVIKGTIRGPDGDALHIAGAKADISLHGLDANGDDAVYTAHMDENGHYSIKVSQGAYVMSARLYTALNGNTVCIDLVPMDGNPPGALLQTKPGIVRDYKLMLSGLLPGAVAGNVYSYAGAHLNVTDGARNFTDYGYWNSLANRFPGGRINFELTPKSALLDGSQGNTVHVSCNVDDVAGSYYFFDFPFAAYEVTATLTTTADEAVPLYLSVLPNLNATSKVTLLYQPDQDDHDGHPVMPTIAIWAQ